MPFTPFHAGPHATIAFLSRGRIDLVAFLLANAVVDIEPLIVLVMGLPHALHGWSHTFALGVVLGSLSGLLCWLGRRPLTRLMNLLSLNWTPRPAKLAVSGVLGSWLHVLADSPIYADIRPFRPFLQTNPLAGTLSIETMYAICAASFVPAIILYLRSRTRHTAP